MYKINKIVLTFRTIKEIPQFKLNCLGILHGDLRCSTYSGLKFITRVNTPDVFELIVVT